MLPRLRRARRLLSTSAKGEDVLRVYFASLTGTMIKRQVMNDNPTLSRCTVERVLQRLQA